MRMHNSYFCHPYYNYSSIVILQSVILLVLLCNTLVVFVACSPVGAKAWGAAAVEAFISGTAISPVAKRAPIFIRTIGDYKKKISTTTFARNVPSLTSPRPPKSNIVRCDMMSSTTVSSSPSYIQREVQVNLSSGVSMQVMLCHPSSLDDDRKKAINNKPVLLFLHGSFHGSWCWMEHYGPFFAGEFGYTVMAPSWRGTGGTFAGDNVKKVKISDHVADLSAFLDILPTLLPNGSTSGSSTDNSDNDDIGDRPTVSVIKPVVIAHSFGGLVVMKYLEKLDADKYDNNTTNHTKRIHDVFAGIVMICSVPPSGNGKMTMRYLRRSLMDSWKITTGFAMKKCLTNINLCRELFFGGVVMKDPNDNAIIIEDYGLSDDDIIRYQQYFKRDSEATIDLLDLAKQLPSAKTSKIDGSAFYVTDLPPVAVMGATNDFIVDTIGVQETANYFGLQGKPLLFIDSPHDVMLGSKWKNGAKVLQEWIVTNLVDEKIK